MKSIRAFIAINLPPPVKELASHIREQFRDCGRTIRWVDPKNVHLTIKFLGDIPKEKIESVGKAIEKAVENIQPFRMEIDGMGTFPNLRHPRVLWMGVKEPSETLVQMETRISSNLATLGFEREKKKFSPHITLGRVRSNEKKALISKLIQSLELPACPEINVKSVELFKSELKPTGAVHSVLGRFDL